MKRNCVKVIILIAVLLNTLLVPSCKKDSKPSMEDEKVEQLKANATFNNSVLPGAGNLFLENKFIANTESQLVAKLAYQQDTIAYYGKINAAGQLQYIHSMIVAKNGGSELTVTEVHPEISTTRIYTISNNQKSRFVIETEQYSKDDVVLNILDYDWSTGNAQVLKTIYFRKGVEVSNARIQGDSEPKPNAANCLEPQPAESLDGKLANFMQWLACGGPAWNGHPTLNILTETTKKAIEDLKPKYQNSVEELGKLKDRIAEIIEEFPSILDKLPDLKWDKKSLESALKKLEELYKDIIQKERMSLTLVPIQVASLLDYDELTDNEIKLTIAIEKVTDGRAYTDKPVFVDFALVDPATNMEIYVETKATSTVNGLVVFKGDPKTIKDYWQYKNLVIAYAFTQDKWNPYAHVPVSLKFMVPDKVEAIMGNSQVGEPSKKLAQPLRVKVTDEYGRVLPDVDVNWKVKTGNGFLISDSKTNAQGLAEAQWTLGISPDNQEVEVVVKRKNGAVVHGAPLIFKATIVNPWIDKLVGTWKKESFLVVSESKYREEETQYQSWLEQPGNTPNLYHFKFMGNNTIMEMNNAPQTITLNRDLTFILTTNFFYVPRVDNDPGIWSVGNTGNLISNLSGRGGYYSSMSGTVVEINKTTLRINNSQTYYTILTK